MVATERSNQLEISIDEESIEEREGQNLTDYKSVPQDEKQPELI